MLRFFGMLCVVTILVACDPAADPDAGAEPDAGDVDPDAGEVALDAGPQDLSLPAPTEALPASLSELGVFGHGDAHEDLVPYAPVHPLWTNGSDKDRYVWLPPGTTIDASGASFDFPVGTYLFKTFSYDEAPVETRVMRRLEDGWEFAVYLWDGDDAVLGAGTIPVDVEVDTSEGTLTHQVPSVRDCRTCHESNPDVFVIGFDALRLAGQLDALTARGVFASRPADAAAIEGRDALETEVLEYLFGNCVHCHNGLSGANRAVDYRAPVFVANVVGVPTQGSASPRGVRVVAGDADGSILYSAMSRETDFVMPPIGVQVVDDEALELVREWIEAL